MKNGSCSRAPQVLVERLPADLQLLSGFCFVAVVLGERCRDQDSPVPPAAPACRGIVSANAVVQIRPKGSILHRLLERGVRGEDHTNIDRPSDTLAETFDGPIIQEIEEDLLHAGGRERQLVEEYRAFICLLACSYFMDRYSWDSRNFSWQRVPSTTTSASLSRTKRRRPRSSATGEYSIKSSPRGSEELSATRLPLSWSSLTPPISSATMACRVVDFFDTVLDR